MAMFDIDGAKSVKLMDNRTSKDELAKLRDVGAVTAERNEAGTVDRAAAQRHSLIGWVKDNILNQAVIALVALATTAGAGWVLARFF